MPTVLPIINDGVGKFIVPHVSGELQEGVCGNFRIAKRLVDDYLLTELSEGSSCLIMSDSPAEIASLLPLVESVYGNVLISGLGIGLFPRLIKDIPEVESITIVEKSPEVIELVYPYISYEKITLVNADIFDYIKTCEGKYDIIFIDLSVETDTIKTYPVARRLLKEHGSFWIYTPSICRVVTDEDYAEYARLH